MQIKYNEWATNLYNRIFRQHFHAADLVYPTFPILSKFSTLFNIVFPINQFFLTISKGIVSKKGKNLELCLGTNYNITSVILEPIWSSQTWDLHEMNDHWVIVSCSLSLSHSWTLWHLCSCADIQVKLITTLKHKRFHKSSWTTLYTPFPMFHGVVTTSKGYFK